MALIRFLLSKLVMFFNWLFSPRSTQRGPDAQAAIDAHTASLVLYQYEACPFCVKVRRAMKRRAMNIGTRDVKRSDAAREASPIIGRPMINGGHQLWKSPLHRVCNAGHMAQISTATAPKHVQPGHG